MTSTHNQGTDLDAIVIGAGFSGLYMLHRLREAGFSVRVYEAGEEVGGVWYWNRYPGARCDSESIYYNYTFSKELYEEWSWSSRFPEQPEILQYLNFAADRLDLRRDIQFKTRIQSAQYDEENNKWRIKTHDGTVLSATYFITAVGCISTANIPKFNGLDNFEGDWYHTGHWPHEKVDFSGKRVGVVGTGSSGVQTIPVIAEEAAHLTVFQRTPQYSIPARNHPYDPQYVQKTKENFEDIKRRMRESMGGIPVRDGKPSAIEDEPEIRQYTYEKEWEKGGIGFFAETYKDLLINEDSNETASAFVRAKIRETVKDPETAKKLSPTYYYAAKRPILDSNYYETFNRENVSLVDVKKAPIEEITARGIKTADGEYELDAIVFATGYDGMTGSLFKMDIRGRNGVALKEKWEDGSQVKTYLGLATSGFPNMFMITGPESPSVLSNMPVSIEQHVEWIGDCIDYLQERGLTVIEAEEEAENKWSKHCREVADTTLYTKTDSWYTGANISDKPRGFPIYVGGVGPYRQICDEIANNGYEGFSMRSAKKLSSL